VKNIRRNEEAMAAASNNSSGNQGAPSGT
jgi:hypothetical protein